jgi:hypothetical protein
MEKEREILLKKIDDRLLFVKDEQGIKLMDIDLKDKIVLEIK